MGHVHCTHPMRQYIPEWVSAVKPCKIKNINFTVEVLEMHVLMILIKTIIHSTHSRLLNNSQTMLCKLLCVMHSALPAMAIHILTIVTHQTPDMLLKVKAHIQTLATEIAAHLPKIAIGMSGITPHTIQQFHNWYQQIRLLGHCCWL